MKRPFPWFAFALMLIAGSALADDADQVRRLDKEINVATWTGDIVWFEENVADEYILITPSGAFRTKRDIISELATAGLKVDPYESSEVDVRMYGDTAVVRGRILQRFLLGRIRYANDLRYTDVWTKKKGRWMLVSGHTSSVAPGGR